MGGRQGPAGPISFNFMLFFFLEGGVVGLVQVGNG